MNNLFKSNSRFAALADETDNKKKDDKKKDDKKKDDKKKDNNNNKQIIQKNLVLFRVIK